jgi:tetratricopeptide (TPR) repeat protein
MLKTANGKAYIILPAIDNVEFIMLLVGWRIKLGNSGVNRKRHIYSFCDNFNLLIKTVNCLNQNHIMNKFYFILLLLSLKCSFLIAQTDVPDVAKKKLQENDFKGAKQDLTKFLEGNPHHKVALNLRGQAKIGLEDFYGAIGDFNFALEQDSTYVEALNYRGEAKMALGDDEGAIVDFDKAIKFNPKQSDAYSNRGLAKYNLEELQGAYFDFSEAIELGPADADKFFNRGVVKSELCEFLRASDDFTKAIE